jgi:protein tyrosine/serine phosphatase
VPAFDLSTTRGRLATYLHHFWYDHAYLRLAFSNAHWLSDELVRANQPWPFQVKAWRDRGIRTIVNLRHGVDAHHILEQEACDRYGVKQCTSWSGRARRRAASRCWAPSSCSKSSNTR